MISLSWDLPQRQPAPERPQHQRPIRGHRCAKEVIDWDSWEGNERDVALGAARGHMYGDDGELLWYGTCTECGRRVEERYYPGQQLYDANTGNEI